MARFVVLLILLYFCLSINICTVVTFTLRCVHSSGRFKWWAMLFVHESVNTHFKQYLLLWRLSEHIENRQRLSMLLKVSLIWKIPIGYWVLIYMTLPVTFHLIFSWNNHIFPWGKVTNFSCVCDLRRLCSNVDIWDCWPASIWSWSVFSYDSKLAYYNNSSTLSVKM